MPKMPSNRRPANVLLLMLSIVLLAAGTLAQTSDTPSEAGAAVTNRADGSYESEGNKVSGTTVTTTATVKSVSGVNVTPDETGPSTNTAPNERVSKLFRICNAGNGPDSFTIQRTDITAPATLISLHFDADASGTLTEGDTPITIGSTASPNLAIGACVPVIAEVDTANSTPETNLTIRLTARSQIDNSASGVAQDEGTIILAVGNRARFTSPDNPALQPRKLVDGRQSEVAGSGQSLSYTIEFRNSGIVPARHVIVTDNLPASLVYEPNSLHLGDRALTDQSDVDTGEVNGQTIKVKLDEVGPNELIQISFRARVVGAVPAGSGIVNTASISGDNSETTSTTSAVAVVDPFGRVYAGRSGGTVLIGGARVMLATDQGGANPLTLPAGLGYAPNTANDDPYAATADGRFSFALTPEQFGTTTSPARYFLIVTAPGYRARLIEVTLSPSTSGVYTTSIRALDGQSIARSNSFALTSDNVSIDDIAALALNVPMFENTTLEIQKSADRRNADVGDVVSYHVEVHNATSETISNVFVGDRLPESFRYAAGTGLVESSSKRTIEPEVSANDLVFRVGEVAPGERLSIVYRVRVGANARDGEQINSAIAEGAFPSGERVATAPARVGVIVSHGVFSTRQLIIGRVFEDVNGNGRFDKGDKPTSGVRLYLDKGQSVITDSAGMYNFPSVEDGAVVIALDPITLPSGYVLSFDERRSDKGWARLLRTPLGGGGLLRQDFALKRKELSESKAVCAKPCRRHEMFIDDKNLLVSSSSQLSEKQSVSLNSENNKTEPVIYKDSAATRLVSQPTSDDASNAAVLPGDVRIISPTPDQVSMTPALEIEAQVAEGWQVALEVNGLRISDDNIGTRRHNHQTRTEAFRFVGINVRPGSNTVKVMAVRPDGSAGRSVELTAIGRGPARRLEIVSEKSEITAGGRDTTILHIRALDAWGHPANDGQVAIDTSAGSLQKGETNSPQQIVSLENGEAIVKLISNNTPGLINLRASTGSVEANAEVRVTADIRPAILVGLAEMSFGRSAPEMELRGDNRKARAHVEFFYKGKTFANSLLTIAYDSQRPLNRTAGRDRLFQVDPLSRTYPLFGDSSVRYEDAQSNSKLYVRVDHKRSFAMFGDMEADLGESTLLGYSRKLTGVKLHLENSRGDQVTMTGARPDTAFARDVFPGDQLGLIRLSRFDIMPGSESIAIEVRDRRNPDVLISRETLIRSVDYNLDPNTGYVFFLRPISTFDHNFNLVQIVATYEYHANDMSSAVYTARASKRFTGLGLRVGMSFIDQRQAEFGSFFLGGVDVENRLPRNGRLTFEWATSHGRVAFGGNLTSSSPDAEHNGNATRVELEQPLKLCEAVVHASFVRSDARFLNPFGSTVTPGAQRITAGIDLKPLKNSLLKFGVTHERNETDNVDNRRLTVSALWTQTIRERLRASFGFDFRRFSDAKNDREIQSKLFTLGADWQATDKLQFSVKREQNLGAADPTYPNQTTLGATYQINKMAKLFFAQRFASAPIVAISDTSTTGFAVSSSRRETQIGVETRLGRNTSLIGRYQLENGINGTDSFAVIGLQNRLPLSKQISLDFGFEHGMHLAGAGNGFTSGGVGFSWQPTEDFRSSGRFELRNQNGRFGSVFTLGAAGRLNENITALARFQRAQSVFGQAKNSSLDGTLALAVRPKQTDRYALLFSYTRRSIVQAGDKQLSANKDRTDTLSTDGLYQATNSLELYGRFALKFGDNSRPDLARTSTLTYLFQGRAQQKLGRYLDAAIEQRWLAQPASGTRRSSTGAELGFWVLPELRLAAGYNITGSRETGNDSVSGNQRGFYFTVSSKLSRFFDLFGSSNNASRKNSQPDSPDEEGTRK